MVLWLGKMGKLYDLIAMDLLVDVEPLSAAAPTCFVTLPRVVAATLIQEEDIPLLVLSIHRDDLSAPSCQVRYVGWVGGASSGPKSLGIHSSFAAALRLEDGQSVRVSAVARERAVDAPEAMACVSVENSDDYAAVTATAEFVEACVMHQIRVLYPGLCFPLSLPGRRNVNFTVVSLRAGGEDLDFLALSSNVELTVLSPTDERAGIEHREAHEGSFRLSWKKPWRALPTPLDLLSAYPTHVLISDQADGHPGQTTSVPVSVRRSAPTQPPVEPLPVMLCVSERFRIPEGHIFVPPHVWWDLELVALTSISMHPLPSEMCTKAPSLLCLLRTCPWDGEAPEIGPSFLESVPTLFFPGMVLGGGEWLVVGGKGSEGAAALRHHRERLERPLGPTELCDVVWKGNGNALPKSFGLAPTAVRDLAVLLGEGPAIHKQSPIPTANSVVWVVGRGQKCEPICGDDREEASYLKRIWDAIAALHSTWPPDGSAEPEGVDVVGALRGSSPRMTVGSIVTHFRERIPGWRHKEESPSAIDAHSSLVPCQADGSHVPGGLRFAIVRGPEGSGKTSIARAVAKILRLFHRRRTVWIRWRSHRNEPTAVSVARVRAAFALAMDSQPSLIVFDDMDLVAGSRLENNVRPDMLESEEQEDAARAHSVARAIVECFDECRRSPEKYVDVLGTYSNSLENELLVPGVVSLATDVEHLTAEDRACILAYFVE